MLNLTQAKKRDMADAALLDLMVAVLECEIKFATLEEAGWPPMTRQQIVNRAVKLIDDAQGA
jgi:hypothetical protein